MNLSNQLSEISALALEKVRVRKSALYDYLIRFLKADGTELFPQHVNLLEAMIQDDNVDLETFSIFVKYLLGVY